MNMVILVSLLILAIGESSFPADSVKFGEPADYRKSYALCDSVYNGNCGESNYCCESTGFEKSGDSDESDGSG